MERFKYHFAWGVIPALVWLYVYYFTQWGASLDGKLTLIVIGTVFLCPYLFIIGSASRRMLSYGEPTLLMKMTAFMSPLGIVAYFPLAYFVCTGSTADAFTVTIAIAVVAYYFLIHVLASLLGIMEGYKSFEKIIKKMSEV